MTLKHFQTIDLSKIHSDNSQSLTAKQALEELDEDEEEYEATLKMPSFARNRSEMPHLVQNNIVNGRQNINDGE